MAEHAIEGYSEHDDLAALVPPSILAMARVDHQKAIPALAKDPAAYARWLASANKPGRLLEAKRPDTGATASYVIEGKLEKDTLAGTFTFDDRKGNFSFTRK